MCVQSTFPKLNIETAEISRKNLVAEYWINEYEEENLLRFCSLDLHSETCRLGGRRGKGLRLDHTLTVVSGVPQLDRLVQAIPPPRKISYKTLHRRAFNTLYSKVLFVDGFLRNSCTFYRNVNKTFVSVLLGVPRPAVMSALSRSPLNVLIIFFNAQGTVHGWRHWSYGLVSSFL